MTLPTSTVADSTARRGAKRAVAAWAAISADVWVLDVSGRVVEILSGRELEDGTTLFDRVAPAQRDRVRGHFARCLAMRERVEFEAVLLGEPPDVYAVRLQPLDAASSEVVVVSRPVGAELRDRNRVEAERTRYEVAVRHSPGAIEITDADLRIQYVNEAWQTMTGFRAAEALGRTPAMLGMDPQLWRTIERQLREGLAWHGRVESRRKDGSRFDEEVSLYPGCDADGRILHFVGVHRDVTGERRVRDAQMVSDRLVTMGTLTAGVAHEIKNAMVPIVSNVAFLGDVMKRVGGQLPEAIATEVESALEDARESVERVRLVTEDLSRFSKPRVDDTLLDLRSILESSARLARHEYKRRARFEAEYGWVPPLTADQARLGQVFLNLIINASHAIEPGDVESNSIRVRTWTEGAGRQAVVEISDTGSGIPAEVLPRVFDAFFTTKRGGIGTGLGLAISRAIVQELRGELTLRSEPGRGTTVRVEFPVDPAAESIDTSGELRRLVRRSRILIIDDEPAIARALARILKKHDVQLAQGGREGLQRLLDEDFDLVFCDLIMPGLTGMELFERLRGLRPQVAEAMVFMTGGAYTGAPAEFLEALENEVVEKPFAVNEIRDFVTRRLAEVEARRIG